MIKVAIFLLFWENSGFLYKELFPVRALILAIVSTKLYSITELPSTSKRSSLIDMIMVNLHFVRDVVPLADSNDTSGIEHKVSSGLNTNQVQYTCLSNLFMYRANQGS